MLAMESRLSPMRFSLMLTTPFSTLLCSPYVSEHITEQLGIGLNSKSVLYALYLVYMNDCLVKGGLPGGETLKNCKPLENMVKKQDSEGRLNAAICCAPALALGTWGLLEGRRVCMQ